MRCPSCHIENPDTQSFCSHCGAAIITDDSRPLPRLGPYCLEARLGEGGMGIVYRATDEQLKREVAIKVLHPQLLKDEGQMDRFRREARMHAKLIHPNVVTLLSLYEDGEHTALVMEMVHGRNLKDYLRQHPKPRLPDVMRICKAILAGLQAAHALGIVHRDLKPANVLLADDGNIKLMDFGLAKLEQGGDDLTQSGATIGSFRYMAPEQILNQSIDARTDLYALGIIIYQMCTGKLPFDASASGGEFEIMEKQVRQPPTPPREINPLLPIAMSDLILALLAKSPGDRPVDCEAVRNMLAAVSRQGSASQVAAIPQLAAPESNLEIARGLFRSYGRRAGRMGRHVWLMAKPYAFDLPVHWMCRVTSWIREHLPERLDTPGMRSVMVVTGILLVWLMLGVILRPGQVPEVINKKHVERPVAKVAPSLPDAGKPSVGPSASKAKVAPPVTTPKPEREHATTEERKPAPQKVTPSPAVAEKSVRQKVAERPAPRPVTYRVSNRVVRSDGSSAGRRDKHEFRGGSSVFFAEDLPAHTLIDKNPIYKSGWIRLYLNRTVKLSSIVIHKVSVGRKSFAGGEIELEVRDRQGHWTGVLSRKNRDIDSPIRIRTPRKALSEVKGVRLRFKTPQPITIGPIDLLP